MFIQNKIILVSLHSLIFLLQHLFIWTFLARGLFNPLNLSLVRFCKSIGKFTQKKSLRRICQNMVFLWPVFSCVTAESKILPLYGKIRVRENPYSGIMSDSVLTWGKTGQRKLVFRHIFRSANLSLYGKTRVRENLSSGIFDTVRIAFFLFLFEVCRKIKHYLVVTDLF